MQRNIARKRALHFFSFQARPDEVCQSYIQGKTDVSQFILQMNQWEGLEDGYDQVIRILRQSGKLDEFDRFCATLSTYIDKGEQRGALLSYIADHAIGEESNDTLRNALQIAELNLSRALTDRIYRPGQPFHASPALWTGDALKVCLGRNGAFTPENPQAAKYLLIMDSNSELEGVEQPSLAIRAEHSRVRPQAETILRAVDDAAQGKLEIAEDPDQASIGIYYRVSYPQRGDLYKLQK